MILFIVAVEEDRYCSRRGRCGARLISSERPWSEGLSCPIVVVMVSVAVSQSLIVSFLFFFALSLRDGGGK